MSSTNSRDYYNAIKGKPGDTQHLPPLRSVLGDQLHLPLTQRRASQSPYDLGDLSRALPLNYSDTHRFTIMNTTHTYSGHHDERSRSQGPYKYSTAVPTHSSLQPPSTTSYHEGHHHELLRGSSHTTSPSSRSGMSRKYACTWEGCDKRFERQNALDTHMNIHLQQKPFACPVPYCGKVFNVRSNMRRHFLLHKDVQFDGEFTDDYNAEEDVQGKEYFHRSRHDASLNAHRRSSEHRGAAPVHRYYSSRR